MPVFGTCAGMILLATEVLDGRPDQRSFGVIDLTVRRNGYGRQLDSFETELDVAGLAAPFHGVFIRAPLVEPRRRRRRGPRRPRRRARSSSARAASWPPRSIPELTADTRLHERFVELVRSDRPTPTPRRSVDMSGHSKWATIKHKKGAVDKARGKLFNKLARQLEVAARAGGGDPDANPTLRTAVQKAKGAQMTNDAIDRAIKRGTGEGDTGTYESIMYEGYAPGGVAMLIDVLTDNRNRTGAEIRGVFTKHGGSLAEPGAVSWQFARRGIVMVDGAADEDELMMAALEAGADDVADDGGTWRVTSEPSLTFDVRDALEAAGFTVESADTPMVSDNLVPITTVEDAKKVLRVIEMIEDNDDVQDVFANFDIPDDVMDRGRWSVGRDRVRRGSRGERRRRGPGPRLHAAGHRRPAVLAGRLPRQAGRARLLPGRRHAGLHQAAQRVQRRAGAVHRPRRPGAGDLGPGRRQPRPVLGQARRLRVPAARRHRQGGRRRCTARSARSGSRGAACSSSTATASIRYAHRAIAGLTYRPVSELVAVLSKL